MEVRSRGSVGLKKPEESLVKRAQDQMNKPEKSLLQRAQDKLIQTLPTFSSVDSNDLKVRGVGVWMAGLYLVLYLTSGVYLLAMGTTSEYNKQYLALTNDKNNSICETIPVHITETYKADKNGTWTTSKAYDPLKTIYELKMTGTTVTDEQYSAVMQNFTAQYKAFGDSTTSLDIIGQQIAWSLFSVKDDDTMMELSTDAELGRMLGSVEPTSKGKPTFSSAEGVCMYDGLEPTFSSQGLVLTASFPANAPPSAAPTPLPTAKRNPTAAPTQSPTATRTPTAAPTPFPTATRNPTAPTIFPTNRRESYYEFCPKQISVGDGTFGISYSDKKSVDINLFRAALAFSLNFGIVNTSLLTRTYSSVSNSGDEVGKFLVEVWTSDRYLAGSYVDCFTKTGQPRVCLANIGSSYVYPVLTTTNKYTETLECLCPEDAKTSGCNSNSNFQLALVFATHHDFNTTGIISAGLKLQSMIKTDGPNKVKSLVAGLAYTADKLYGHSYRYDDWLKGAKIKLYGETNDVPSYSEFKKSFGLMGPGISIMSFDLFYFGELAPFNAGGVYLLDLATTKFQVTSEYGYTYNISQVSCTNTIFRRSALQHMSLKPPVPVVQPYLSCRPTLPRAILTAAGLAAASSSLVSSIFLTLFVAATVVYFNNHRDKSLKIVAPAEKSLEMAETVKMLQAENQRMSSRMEVLERIVQGSAGLDSRQSRGSELYGDLSDQEYANGQQRRMSRLSMRNSIQQQQEQEQEQERPSLRKSLSSNGSVSSAPSVARVAVPTSMAGAIAFVSRRHPLETPGLSAGGRASIISAPQHSQL